MGESKMRKIIALGIILLFLGMTMSSSTEIIVFNDDTTPPVTTHSLDPPEPDGENGYYVNIVEVTLNSTDDLSGVKEIFYAVGSGSWYTIVGENGTFLILPDDNDMLIRYYAIDNAGNEEEINSFIISKDETPPDVDYIDIKLCLEDKIWYLDYRAHAEDDTSGMDRVEFFIDDEHQETIEGSGPDYDFLVKYTDVEELIGSTFWFYHYDRAGNEVIKEWDTEWLPELPSAIPRYVGLIYNPEITEGNVSFFAILVLSIDPYSSHLIKLKPVTVEYDYEGYIGKYFIRIFLNDWYPAQEPYDIGV